SFRVHRRRQGLRLKPVEKLEAVLQGPEELVVVGKLARGFVLQQTGVEKALEGGQGVRRAEAGKATAVLELKKLDQELDVADAAPAGLDVGFGFTFEGAGLLDAALVVADLVEELR